MTVTFAKFVFADDVSSSDMTFERLPYQPIYSPTANDHT